MAKGRSLRTVAVWLMLATQLPPSGASGHAQSDPMAAIPQRPYYPADYRELRVAAALLYRTFRQMQTETDREGGPLAEAQWVSLLGTQDIVNCNADEPDPDLVPAGQMVLARLALQIARIEDELSRAGYRRDIFDQPLAAYEQERLIAITAARDRHATSPEAAEDDWENGPVARLAGALEARRARLQPRLPPIVAEGGCGAGEVMYRIRTLPGNGRVWLINAFAFHVCRARGADPWRIDDCRWTEADLDRAAPLSGRYMYRVRWPDGAERRGIREFAPGDPSEDEVTIYFRRN